MGVQQNFTVKAEHSDNSFTVGDGWLSLSRHKSDWMGKTEYWWDGLFRDGRGLVSIYMQSGVTDMQFAHGGRVYSRRWQTAFGERTISRLARAFITDVMEQAA